MTDEDILGLVWRGLVRAEHLHPLFAEGAAQGLGNIGEERRV